MQPFGTSALSLEVVCGVLITTSMVYYILQQRTEVKKQYVLFSFFEVIVSVN